MKKSDFLEQLYKAVDDHLNNSEDCNLVDFIIHESEKLGMLPPATTTKSVLPGMSDFTINQ